MARKKDGAKESANRRRVAEDVARIRSAGIPVLAKDIAESLSMSTVTVGKHLRALGLSFHGPMGWYGPDEGEYSAGTRAPNAGCAPSSTVDGAMAEADHPDSRRPLRVVLADAGRERVIEDMGDQARMSWRTVATCGSAAAFRRRPWTTSSAACRTPLTGGWGTTGLADLVPRRRGGPVLARAAHCLAVLVPLGLVCWMAMDEVRRTL